MISNQAKRKLAQTSIYNGLNEALQYLTGDSRSECSGLATTMSTQVMSLLITEVVNQREIPLSDLTLVFLSYASLIAKIKKTADSTICTLSNRKEEYNEKYGARLATDNLLRMQNQLNSVNTSLSYITAYLANLDHFEGFVENSGEPNDDHK